MKLRIILSLLLILVSSIPCWSDTKIQMEEYGGVYRIPCLVNGARMKMIFDTGASVVSLSLPMAEYLLDNGYISKADFKGQGQSVVADGEIVDHLKLNLKDITIEGIHIKNVEAIVIASQEAPLLFGQSAIKKLGNVHLNGNVLVIPNSTGDSDISQNDYSDEDKFEKAWDFYNNERYNKAYDIYLSLYQEGKLSDYGKFLLGRCCFEISDYTTGINVMETIKEFDNEWLRLLGTLCIRNGSREDAVYYYNKAYEAAPSKFEEGVCLWYLGNAYAFGGGNMYKIDYDKALEYYTSSLLHFEKFYNLETNHLFNISLNNREEIEIYRLDSPYIDDLVYNIVDLSWLTHTWSYRQTSDTMIQLSKNGNSKATKWLNR